MGPDKTLCNVSRSRKKKSQTNVTRFHSNARVYSRQRYDDELNGNEQTLNDNPTFCSRVQKSRKTCAWQMSPTPVASHRLFAAWTTIGSSSFGCAPFEWIEKFCLVFCWELEWPAFPFPIHSIMFDWLRSVNNTHGFPNFNLMCAYVLWNNWSWTHHSHICDRE